MEKDKFIISKKEFNKLNNYAQNVYNAAVVIDYFCSNQKEIEELSNLAPVIKNLRNEADLLYTFFIDYDN